MAKMREVTGSPLETKRNIVRRILQVASTYVLIALLLLIPSGSPMWPGAWFYMAIYLSVIIIGALVLPLDVISERGSIKKNVEKWDRLMSGLLIVSSLGTFPVAGLDHRFSWTPRLDSWLVACSGLMFLFGCLLNLWAMSANHFFSTSVRIQSERMQTVCDTGPYRFVRHPGYLGMIIYNVATPTLLGSLWALIPAMTTVVLFVLRTCLEDATLRRKLPGYEEYASRVGSRLLPGIW